MPGDGLGDQRLALGLVGDVGGDKAGIGAHVVQRLERGGSLVLIAAGDDDPGTQGGDAARHPEADPAVAASDDGDFSLEVEQVHRLAPRSGR